MIATWTCGACGKRTDGLSGIDDAMDCFCPRCPRCGGLTDYLADGEECTCEFGQPEPWRPIATVEVKADVL